MPTLLQDLAEETSASNRRVADRLDAEARELGLRRAEAAPGDLGQDALAVARLATDFAISQVSWAEEFWQSALAELVREPTGDAAERLLRTLLDVFESGRQLVRASRALWELAEQLGAAPEQSDELDRADELFKEWAAEVNLALEHRAGEWRPTDPDRLAAGLKLAREGKTVTADEARAWFRRG